jgi:hypothetical protein
MDRPPGPGVLEPGEVQRRAALEDVVEAADEIGGDPVLDDPVQHAPGAARPPELLVEGPVAPARDIHPGLEPERPHGVRVLSDQLQKDARVVRLHRRAERARREVHAEEPHVALGVEEPAVEGQVAVDVVGRHDREDRLQRGVPPYRGGGEELVDAEV